MKSDWWVGEGGCLKLGVLAGEKLVGLLVLGHGLGNNVLWQRDALALVESNGVEVVAKILLVKATYEKGSNTNAIRIQVIRNKEEPKRIKGSLLTCLDQRQPCM